MKVIHINEHLDRKGGVETYMLAVLPLLREQGLDLAVVYETGDSSNFPASIQLNGLGSSHFSTDRTVENRLREVLAWEKPDLLHIHNVQNVGVYKASLDYGPTLITAHDFRTVCPASMFFYKKTQEICGRKRGLGCFTTTLKKGCMTLSPGYATYSYHRTGWISKKSSKLARVIAPSQGAKERLVKSDFNREQISVLPYFCPVEPVKEPRPIPKTPTITFIGRMTGNKGPKYFFEALGKLPDFVRGKIVGSIDDETERQIYDYANEQGWQRDRLDVHRWATPSEIMDVLDNTTVFIFPSLWSETLGIVGIEAMARGVPVVASDVGGVREWLYDGKNGYLVEPKNPEQICEAVLKLIASDETLIEFGMRCIETINEKFLPTSHVDKLIRIYEDVLHKS